VKHERFQRVADDYEGRAQVAGEQHRAVCIGEHNYGLA
jgi:hypothetical protein